jgi:uncharacterized protein (DUF58 family)
MTTFACESTTGDAAAHTFGDRSKTKEAKKTTRRGVKAQECRFLHVSVKAGRLMMVWRKEESFEFTPELSLYTKMMELRLRRGRPA